MIQALSLVTRVAEVAHNIFALEFLCSDISRSSTPGQFVNIKIDSSTFPLLRRPMSICDVDGDRVKILFKVVGRGTAILAKLKPGDIVDVLGPLGHGFDTSSEFDLALIVAGGLGVAPFPLLSRILSKKNVEIASFIGARSSHQLLKEGLANILSATDDGSEGYHGTVVDLLRHRLPQLRTSKAMIFACGPTSMFRALQELIQEFGFRCQVSVETPMACGIGLCQGCAVELVDGSPRYQLSCKDGPVFDLSKIVV